MLLRKLLRPVLKPACEEIISNTSTEVITLVDRSTEDTAGIIEAGILIVGLVSSIVLPHNPLGKMIRAMRSLW